MPCALRVRGGVFAQVISTPGCDSPYVVPDLCLGVIKLQSSNNSIQIDAECGRLVLVLPSATLLTDISAVGGTTLLVHTCSNIDPRLRLTVDMGSAVMLPPQVVSLETLDILGTGTVCCTGGLVVTRSLSVTSSCHDGQLQVSGIRVLQSMQTTLEAAYVRVSANRGVTIVNNGVGQPIITLSDGDVAE